MQYVTTRTAWRSVCKCRHLMKQLKRRGRCQHTLRQVLSSTYSPSPCFFILIPFLWYSLSSQPRPMFIVNEMETYMCSHKNALLDPSALTLRDPLNFQYFSGNWEIRYLTNTIINAKEKLINLLDYGAVGQDNWEGNRICCKFPSASGKKSWLWLSRITIF